MKLTITISTLFAILVLTGCSSAKKSQEEENAHHYMDRMHFGAERY